MKFSESWLREWTDPNISSKELVAQLTMAGLEVDGIEPAGGEFSGVVVGEILGAEQHPDADKLRVCRVAGPNDETFSVVCGAANARAGIKVPFAMIGAMLPGNFKIKKAKLRGVESFGMLCAQTELGIGDDDDGLWELPADAPTGEDLNQYLALNDHIIEVDLTPNRGDCLSILGIARDVGVLNRCAVAELAVEPAAIQSERALPVELKDPSACPRYLGRVIEGIDLNAATPIWMQEKLRRSDIRCVDPIVDVTNYVLLELGQPMHAFDLAKLKGGIQVRQAVSGEKLTLLNDQEVELQDGTLLIADDTGPVAIAGIMGGARSAVSNTTRDIFLESAFFAPLAIAGKARSYGLHTDASHRFERGVDFDIAATALERATQLILEIAGGKAGPITRSESANDLPRERRVVLRKQRIQSLLGLTMSDAEVVDTMQGLGLVLENTSDEAWTFSVPSHRFDVEIEADLLEEIARVYGYDKLPTRTLKIPQQLPTKSETQLSKDTLNAVLINRDYNEVISYSFIDPSLHQILTQGADAVELLNPISADMSVMRTSLIPGLLKTLQTNVKRQHTRLKIFESGLSFVPNKGSVEQRPKLAGLIYGEREDPSWVSEKGRVDFYDLKGDVEALLSLTGLGFDFEAGSDQAFLHPGQSARVSLDGTDIGYIGALHPETAKKLGVKHSVFVFELDLESLLKAKPPSFKEVSKYPSVERDLAFVVDDTTAVKRLTDAIYQSVGENLKQLKVFDIYSGEGIDSKRKSVAFNLTFQHSSRTLSEEEVNASVQAVVARLKGDFNATLRQ